MDGITPDDLKINELLLRLTTGEVKEIIMATNPTVNGTATAVYINKFFYCVTCCAVYVAYYGSLLAY